MKHLFTLAAMLTLTALQANAKVWRVNNNTGVQADYTTISAAVTAAAAGDTIYIEGSATAYNESDVISKKLTFIGTGYFLSDTANHETQWNTNPATVGHFAFNHGSAGSKVSGLYMNSYQYLNDSDITIERCYVSGSLIFGNGSNINCDHDTVRQCVITSQISCQPNGGTFSAQGEMVYNNIINGSVSFSGSLGLPNTSVYFINNDFLDNTSFTTENCVYQNNIFYGPIFGSYGSSNYFANNIFSNSSSSSSVPAGNNNQFSIDMKNVYVAASSNPYNAFSYPPTGMSHDGQFMLIAGTSPALNAGNINGATVDCGAYGGLAPYILSGMPNIPSIYSLTVPAQVNDGTPSINISLSAAAH